MSIVSKCANAYALDESVSMNTEHRSQTDGKQSALFDGNISSSSRSSSIARHANDADNQTRKSALNVTAIDNSIDVPKPNDATADATMYQTSRESRNTLTEVETGKVHPFSHSFSPAILVRGKKVLHTMIQIKWKIKSTPFIFPLIIFYLFHFHFHFHVIGIQLPLNKE